MANLLPAQAGMILSTVGRLLRDDSAPRAGGDDPGIFLHLPRRETCSPRRRG